MAVIKCKMCGGDLVLIEGQSVAECEYCGSRQTVPAADNEKKLIQFERAERLRKNCEFDKAAGLYEAIVSDFRQESEAYWGLVLCKYGIEYVDDPATGKKIPTCHRSSFDSVMDDSNFEQAMENADELALRVYRQEAKQIETIRKGILEASSSEKPYDIFICYKETDSNGDRTVDSLLAQDIYDALVSKGYRVFFSRITLEDKLGQAYEPYIFAALNSAKIMLAVGTCYEHYNAVWVKNEWSRYLKIVAQDKSKYLIPCYKGLDAYDMPKEFAHLQGQDMGKVGAIADLLRGIEKLIPCQKSNTVVVQEKVVVGNVGGSNKIASLLDRGNMALEDGDWAKADSFFEDVLNNDSKNAQAYIGKTLAQERCRTMDALVRKRKDVYQNVGSEKLYIQEKTAHISEMAEQYSLSGYVEQESIRELYRFDLSYASEVSGRQKQYREEELWWQNHKQLSRAEKFAVGAVVEHLQNEKKHLFAQLADRVKKAQEADARAVAKLEAAYDAHIAEADKQAEQICNDGLARREKNYENWLEQARKETNPDTLKTLVQNFVGLGEYKDSRNLAEHCRKRAAEEQAKIDAEAERQRVIAEQKFKVQQTRKKTITVIATACVVLVLAVALVVTKVIIPGNAYKEAEMLLADGKNGEAAILFASIENYRDAKARCLEIWNVIADRRTIDAGFAHTVALKNDGTVVASGSVYRGECPVDNWNDVIAVSSGAHHVIGLKSNGQVLSAGSNSDGQCAVGNWYHIVSVDAGDEHTVGLKQDGTVRATGNNEDGQCNVSDWNNIIAISAGNKHTVGLKSDGTVVAVGNNYSGQCDVGSWSDIVDISAGYSYTIGLQSDGTVVVVGSNDGSRCEIDSLNGVITLSAGGWHSVGLKYDGSVATAGSNRYGQGNTTNWTEIVGVYAGREHTVGLKSDGTVVATGSNEFGQCDISEWTNIRLPKISEEQQSAMASVKQKREAQLAAEKKAEEERLAKEYAAAEELAENGKTAKAALAFSKLGTYRDAKERCLSLWDASDKGKNISAGWEHTVALRNDGFVVTTGDNREGRCNTDDWKDIISISAGGTHTVGLRNDGTVVAVGYNKDGRCDTQNWKNIIAISAGMYHTIGLRSDGTVVALGDNRQGQCDINDWKNIVAVSAGKYHTVGLRSDGTVVASGYNKYSACDTENWTDIIAVCAGNDHTVGLRSDGTVVAVGYDEVAKGYPTSRCDTEQWTDIVAVSAGSSHTVGLRRDGTVVSVGPDKYGQGDTGDWTDIVAISAEGWHTVGLRSDGSVVAVGWNETGQCNVSDWTDIKRPN